MDFADHVIEAQFDQISLTDSLEKSTTQNPNCQKFLQQERARIAQAGFLQYSYETELFTKDSFRTHTSGSGDYKQGGERTPSTLDENYTRIQDETN